MLFSVGNGVYEMDPISLSRVKHKETKKMIATKASSLKWWIKKWVRVAKGAPASPL